MDPFDGAISGLRGTSLLTRGAWGNDRSFSRRVYFGTYSVSFRGGNLLGFISLRKSLALERGWWGCKSFPFGGRNLSYVIPTTDFLEKRGDGDLVS